MNYVCDNHLYKHLTNKHKIMKKILLICILCINYFSFSQIRVIPTVPIEKIGRIGENGTSDIFIQKEGNEYTVSFKNTEETELGTSTRFSFKDLAGDFESLYKIISDGFIAANTADIKLDLPNDIVWLHYVKTLQKTVNLQFMTKAKTSAATGISAFMTKEDINSLFGKK